MRRLLAAFLLLSGAALAQPPGYGPGPTTITGTPGNITSFGAGGVAGDSTTLSPPAVSCSFIGLPNGSSPAGSVQVGPYCAPVTVSRNSIATTGLFTDAPGSTYTTCAVNTPCFRPNGLMSFQGATNYLLNSDSPATQTTGSLTAGTYTLWVIGTGTATPSAGTATGCTGFATTSAGTPTNFTCTGAGTVTVTVSGSLNRFQLENTLGNLSNYATSYIPTTSAPVTRQPDVMLMSFQGQPSITMAAAYVPMGAGANDTQTPLQIDEGDNNQRFDLDLGNGMAGVGPGLTAAGAAQPILSNGSTINGAWYTGVVGKMAFTVSSTGFNAFAYNGQTPATGTGVTSFTPSRIQIGSGANTVHQCKCILEWVNVWWQALPVAQLQQITK